MRFFAETGGMHMHSIKIGWNSKTLREWVAQARRPPANGIPYFPLTDQTRPCASHKISSILSQFVVGCDRRVGGARPKVQSFGLARAWIYCQIPGRIGTEEDAPGVRFRTPECSGCFVRYLVRPPGFPAPILATATYRLGIRCTAVRTRKWKFESTFCLSATKKKYKQKQSIRRPTKKEDILMFCIYRVPAIAAAMGEFCRETQKNWKQAGCIHCRRMYRRFTTRIRCDVRVDHRSQEQYVWWAFPNCVRDSSFLVRRLNVIRRFQLVFLDNVFLNRHTCDSGHKLFPRSLTSSYTFPIFLQLDN